MASGANIVGISGPIGEINLDCSLQNLARSIGNLHFWPRRLQLFSLS